MKRLAGTILFGLAVFVGQGLEAAPDDTSPDPILLPVMSVKPYYAGAVVPNQATQARATVRKDGWVAYRLLNKTKAYRNDKRARVWFEVPQVFRGAPTRLRVVAYSDDGTYTRCLHLDLDGHGGYVESSPYVKGSSQFFGPGVIGRRQTISRLWSVGDMKFRADMKGVNMHKILDSKAEHTLTTWISTYAKYGPGSWVTVDIEFKLEV